MAIKIKTSLDVDGSLTTGEYGVSTGHIKFDTTPTNIPTSLGTCYWDTFYRTASLIDGIGNTTLQIGQEERVLVHNNTGVDITDGQVVYVTGSTGELPSVALANANSEATSSTTIGVATEVIPNGRQGFIITSGIIHGLNTLAFNEGELLWLSTTSGAFTNVAPISPNHLVLIGYVIKKAGGNGSILVKIQNTQELKECSDVLFNTLTNNDVLTYESATSLWKNKSISTVLGYTPANDSLVAHLAGTETFTGYKTFSPTVTASSAIARGTYFTPSLTASANNDVLVGLDINPTFTNGAFTGVTNNAIRVAGNIIPSASYLYNLGNSSNRFVTVYSTYINSGGTGLGLLTQGGVFSVSAQASTVAQLQMFSTGNIVIQNGGTFTDAGYILDVNGTTRLNNTTTLGVTPTTSASAYDILTRNTSTGIIEKVVSSTFALDSSVVHKSLTEIITGYKTFTNLLDSQGGFLSSFASTNAFNAGGTNITINNSSVGANSIEFNINNTIGLSYRVGVDTDGLFKIGSLAETTKFTFSKATGLLTTSGFVKTGGTSSQFLKADGSVDSNSYQTILTNPVTGTGTNGYVSFWNGTNTQTGDSGFFWDNTNKRLGIGTIVPNELLSLYKSDRPYIQFTSATTGTTSTDGMFMGFATASGEFQLRNKEAQAITVLTSDVERIRVLSTGQVGFGTTTPIGKVNIFTGLTGIGDFNITSQENGSISFANIASTTAVPAIIGKSNNNTGLYFISATNNTNANADAEFNVRQNTNADFTTLTTPAYRFSRFGTPLIDILRNGATTFASSVTATDNIYVNGSGNTNVTFQQNGVPKWYTGYVPSITGFRFSNGTTDVLKLSDTGAATFASSITTGDDINIPTNKAYRINGNRFVYYDGTTYIGNIDNANPGSSTIIRAAGGNSLTITSTHAATFASTVSATQFNFTGNSFGNNNSGIFFNGVGNYGAGVLSDSLGTTLKLQSGGTTRAVILPSGDFGIGTTSPSSILHLYKYSSTTDPLTPTNTSSLIIQNPYGSTSNSGSALFFKSDVGTNNTFAGVAGNMQGSTATGSWGHLTFGTKANDSATTLTERMRITDAGNVGIGTTSPSNLVQLSKTISSIVDDSSMYLGIGSTENLANSYRLIGFGYKNLSIYPAYIGYQETNNGSNTTGDLIFGTRTGVTNVAPSERMRITSGGNVGIGTISPQQKFVVSNGGANGFEVYIDGTTGMGIQSYNRSTSTYGQMKYDASSHIFQVGSVLVNTATDNGVDKFQVSGSGYFSNQIESAYRLKLPGLMVGYWDGANNRFENTTRPMLVTSYGQDVSFGFDGTGNALVLKYSTGHFGIGTTPLARLHVNGNQTFTSPGAASTAGEIVFYGTGTGLTAGNIYYLNTSLVWTACNAGAASTSSGLLAIALGTTVASGMLLRGQARFASAQYTGATAGQTLYASTTAGSFSGTAPTGSTQVVRVIGYCIDATNDTIHFCPDTTWITLV